MHKMCKGAADLLTVTANGRHLLDVNAPKGYDRIGVGARLGHCRYLVWGQIEP